MIDVLKKFLTYSSVIVLGGCLSSSGGSIGGRGNIGSSNRPSDGDENSGSDDGGNPSASTMPTLIKVADLVSNIEAENESRIKAAFKTANLNYGTSSKEWAFAKEALQNKSTSPITTRIADLNAFLDLYTADYKTNIENKEKYSALYLSQGPLETYVTEVVNGEGVPEVSLTEEAKNYAYFLSQNVNSGIAYVENSLGYIDAVHNYLLEKIIALGLSGDVSTYNAAYVTLGAAIDSINLNVSLNEINMLAALKKLDPSITDLPLMLSNLVDYYTKEKNILDAVKEVSLVSNPVADPNNVFKVGALSDGSVAYQYNDVLKDYVIALNETDRSGLNKVDGTILFKASDFSLDGKSYIASSERDVLTQTDFYTFMPNLKSYIYAGGSLDVEVKARIEKARAIVNKKKAGTILSAEEQLIFDNWFNGTSFSYGASDAKIDVSKLLDALLSRNTIDFTVDKNVNITDTVRLGGQVLGLSFADFGLWEVKGVNSYSGDTNIISMNPQGNLLTDTYYVDYPFFVGMDAFKTGYTTDNKLAANQYVSFTGNTFAVAQKSGVNADDTIRLNMEGTAKLTVSNNNPVDSVLSLKFDDYYTFNFGSLVSAVDDPKNIFVIDGFSTEGANFSSDKVLISGSPSSKILFGAGADITASLSGSMYGLEMGRPTEAVGYYTISSNDIHNNEEGKYTKIDIVGSFGVKK